MGFNLKPLGRKATKYPQNQNNQLNYLDTLFADCFGQFVHRQKTVGRKGPLFIVKG